VGFLHLLEQAVKLLGFGATAHVGVLLRVVLAVLGGSQSDKWRRLVDGGGGRNGTEEEEEGDEEEDEEEEGGDDVAGAQLRHANQAAKVTNDG